MLSDSKTFESYSKSDLKSIKIESYFSVYDEIFKKYIGKKIVFVEIGILHGGSLEMWRDYFGNQARIIGIDINPEAKKLENRGFEIYIGSQSSKDFWDNFFKEVGPVDIVLDDGGHQYKQQIITAHESIKNINDGGAALTAYGKIQYVDMSNHERELIKESLLKYCELDTLAMVMIYEHLKYLLIKIK